METSVRNADHVILVCTPRFRERADSAQGGVGYEKIVVTGEIFSGLPDPRKFVPILRAGVPADSLPSYLKARAFIDFREDSLFNPSFQVLLRHVHRAPEYVRPPLGPRPDLPPKEDQAASLASDASAGLIYCPYCGRQPGTYSSCIGGAPHDYQRFRGPQEHVICVCCGGLPGQYSSCIGGKKHMYKQFTRPSDAIFCMRCGRQAGHYSSCIGGRSHNFREQ